MSNSSLPPVASAGQPQPRPDVYRDTNGDVWVRRGGKPCEPSPGSRGKHLRLAVEAFSPKEYALFNVLYDHCGQPCSKLIIWESVWPECVEGGPDPDSIFQVVNRLRESIETDPQRPRYIITVRAVGGYKLVGCI